MLESETLFFRTGVLSTNRCFLTIPGYFFAIVLSIRVTLTWKPKLWKPKIIMCKICLEKHAKTYKIERKMQILTAFTSFLFLKRAKCLATSRMS